MLQYRVVPLSRTSISRKKGYVEKKYIYIYFVLDITYSSNVDLNFFLEVFSLKTSL